MHTVHCTYSTVQTYTHAVLDIPLSVPDVSSLSTWSQADVSLTLLQHIPTLFTHQKLQLCLQKVRIDDFFFPPPPIFNSSGAFIKFSPTTELFFVFLSFCLLLYWIWLENLLTQLGPPLMWNQFQQRHTRVCCLASNSAGTHLWPSARLGKDSTNPQVCFLPPFTAGSHKRGRRGAYHRVSKRSTRSHSLKFAEHNGTQCTLCDPGPQQDHTVRRWSTVEETQNQSDNKTLVHLTTQCVSRLKHVRTNELLLENGHEKI